MPLYEKKIISDNLTNSTVENISYNSEGNPSASSKYAVADEKNHIILERSLTIHGGCN